MWLGRMQGAVRAAAQHAGTQRPVPWLRCWLSAGVASRPFTSVLPGQPTVRKHAPGGALQIMHQIAVAHVQHLFEGAFGVRALLVTDSVKEQLHGAIIGKPQARTTGQRPTGTGASPAAPAPVGNASAHLARQHPVPVFHHRLHQLQLVGNV